MAADLISSSPTSLTYSVPATLASAQRVIIRGSVSLR